MIKEVCKKCINKYRLNHPTTEKWDWNIEDEYYWRSGDVWCPHYFRDKKAFRTIWSKYPLNCSYKAEHLILGQGNVE